MQLMIDPPQKPQTPDESPIPPREDPARPDIPEEIPQPNPDPSPADNPPVKMQEFGGRQGPEETRFGDWELNGKCVDF